MTQGDAVIHEGGLAGAQEVYSQRVNDSFILYCGYFPSKKKTSVEGGEPQGGRKTEEILRGSCPYPPAEHGWAGVNARAHGYLWRRPPGIISQQHQPT